MAEVGIYEIKATLIDARPDCSRCQHPGSEHTGPDLKCRICGDSYQYPSDEDLPSSTLLGE